MQEININKTIFFRYWKGKEKAKMLAVYALIAPS